VRLADARLWSSSFQRAGARCRGRVSSAGGAVVHHSGRLLDVLEVGEHDAEVLVNRSPRTRRGRDERNARQEQAQRARQSPGKAKHAWKSAAACGVRKVAGAFEEVFGASSRCCWTNPV
jgi:hypothetical protein